MIAADTNVWIGFLNGKESKSIAILQEQLAAGRIIMPPVVLFELLSGNMSEETRLLLIAVPMIPLTSDYWIKASELRKRVLNRGLKSRTADCLIAQSCIDSRVFLITDDKDFRHYTNHGLKLMKP